MVKELFLVCVIGGRSSAGRAPPLQGGGSRFKSGRLHHFCFCGLLILYILMDKVFPVIIAKGKHPFPFRTRKLSPSALMVLPL